MSALERRNQALASLSELSINGQIIQKLDFIGHIYIYGQPYFNIFRRYNNVYEFIIEDYMGDFHFHKDYTVSQSIQRILCLTESQILDAFIISANAINNQSSIEDKQVVLSMRWSEIHRKWQGIFINMGGIHNEFHHQPVVKQEETPSRPTFSIPPAAPHKSVFPLPSVGNLQPTNLTTRFNEVENVPSPMILRNGKQIFNQ